MNDLEEQLARDLRAQASGAPKIGARRVQVSTRTMPRLSVFTSAAAVAAVIVAAPVITHLIDSGSAPATGAPAASPSVTVTGADSTGPETVDLGRGRIALAVPANWARADDTCGLGSQNRVILGVGQSRLCAPIDTSFSSVDIAGTQQYDGATNFTPVGLDGVSASATPVTRSDGVFERALVVSSENVAITIKSPDRDVVDGLFNSIHALPGDKVAMPNVTTGAGGGQTGYSDLPSPGEIRARLISLPLNVKFVFTEGASADHWDQVSASVQTGDIVTAGSTVVVTYR